MFVLILILLLIILISPRKKEYYINKTQLILLGDSIFDNGKYVGEGKWNLKKFEYIIKTKKRVNCAPPAPAYGLYLFKVYY